jgi:hypothetical protein
VSTNTVASPDVIIPRHSKVIRRMPADTARFDFVTAPVAGLSMQELGRIEDLESFATRRILSQVSNALYTLGEGRLLDIWDNGAARPHLRHRALYWMTRRFRSGAYVPLAVKHRLVCTYLDYSIGYNRIGLDRGEFSLDILWTHETLRSNVMSALEAAGYSVTVHHESTVRITI